MSEDTNYAYLVKLGDLHLIENAFNELEQMNSFLTGYSTGCGWRGDTERSEHISDHVKRARDSIRRIKNSDPQKVKS